MQVEIEHLKEIGADLFAEEIRNLQIKIENAKAEIAAAVDQAVDDVKKLQNRILYRNMCCYYLPISFLLIRNCCVKAAAFA